MGNKKRTVAVIGGGASGLAAAIAAAEAGAQVTVLEKASRVGRKILASGNGRCNLMNLGPAVYFGDPAFAETALEAADRAAIRAFLERTGLRLADRPEEDGRLYPACGQASAVLDALRQRCGVLGVRVVTDCGVTQVVSRADGFLLRTAQGDVEAERVVCAAGSPAGGKLGGDAYGLMTALGHRLIAPRPALAPLNCDMRGLQGLKGLRCPAVLTLSRDEKPIEAAGGEILFTDTGVSGVCAMQLARAAEAGQTLHIDFSPLMALRERTHFHTLSPEKPGGGCAAALAYLRGRAHTMEGAPLLTGLLPPALIRVAEREKADLPGLARLLTDFRLRVTGTRGMEGAQAAHGGLDTRSFDPKTMASRRVPGLFVTGEMLNVDGECGGFNLMFAWCSGMLAGRAAAE